ncbi:Methylase involved in ubiquinone/menaquinone biosynthesis [Pyrobaculum oguniense TE7]|uniref:Methylase involved in ubiquinone/menaquinone biosynthesis n=1 Tax=Pyrobaculum oguniense (strain DSM 13380 / JCM 10595 / TE7) TaxID=698757 RepID=H6QD17_PYROT|nr:Methylase involved in ubiquinone/menaquinone biosynthesis [Pyrobaculum oguniense TE7]
METFGEGSAAFYNLLVKLKLFDWAYGLAYKYIAKLTSPGSYVLEIGPGVGELLRRLERGGCKAVGLDASPPMLKYAQRRVPGVSAVGVSFKAPLRGGAFDAAVALFTVHHWGDHENSVEEVRRVLKPGSYFVVVEVDLRRMPLVGSHGCTEECLKSVLGRGFDTVVEKRFPLLVAVAKKA